MTGWRTRQDRTHCGPIDAWDGGILYHIVFAVSPAGMLRVRA